MKIALCFSGAIREFKYCYPSIYKYIIEPLNPDIFVHGWIIKNTDKLNVKFKMKSDSCNKEYVIDKLDPKDYVIDEYTEKWESYIIKKAGITGIDFLKNIPKKYDKICKTDKYAYKKYVYNACGMYYKIMKCNELKCKYEKKHNFKYDIVIRIRFDFQWNNYLLIDDINVIKDNEIVIMKDDYVTMSTKITNDKFFYGTSDTMNKFCNIFNDIKRIYDKGLSIQGSDISEYYLLHFKVKLIGDKNYYHKFHKIHNKKEKMNKVIFIEIIDKITLYIATHLLDNNYTLHGYCKDELLNNIINCYVNYISSDKISETADIYILSNLEYKNNKKNIFYINNDKYDKNISIKCSIINELIIKRCNYVLKENECYIIELSEFICYYILNNLLSTGITISGSKNMILSVGEDVKYNTFFHQNKIKKYVPGKILNINKKLYDIQLDKEIIKDCPSKYIDVVNKMKYFKNNLIYSKCVT